MKFRSYNEEMYIAQSLLASQFNNIVIDRRWRDNSPAGGGKSIIKDTFSIPCIFGARDTILKELENESGTIKLPLIILTSKAIRTDPSRNVDINMDILYQIDGHFDPNKKRALPVDIDYSLTVVTRYREDLEQIITNFIVHYKPDTYMKWKHPKNNSQIIESQVVWDQQFSLDDVTETKTNTQIRHKANSQFTFKTWIFPGIDQFDKNISGNGIIETINYWNDDFIDYPEIGDQSYRQNKFWIVNQGMEIDQMRNNIISGLVTNPCNHDDIFTHDTWEGSDNGWNEIFKNTLTINIEGKAVGSVTNKMVNLGKDPNNIGTKGIFKFDNKQNEQITKYTTASIKYNVENKILTIINTLEIGSIKTNMYFQATDSYSCVGLSIEQNKIGSFIYQDNYGIDFTYKGYTQNKNTSIYPTTKIEFDNDKKLLSNIHDVLKQNNQLEFKQYSTQFGLNLSNKMIDQLLACGLDKSEIDIITNFSKINLKNGHICLLNHYYYYVFDSNDLNDLECQPIISGPIINPSLKNPIAFCVNGQYIGLNYSFVI